MKRGLAIAIAAILASCTLPFDERLLDGAVDPQMHDGAVRDGGIDARASDGAITEDAHVPECPISETPAALRFEEVNAALIPGAVSTAGDATLSVQLEDLDGDGDLDFLVADEQSFMGSTTMRGRIFENTAARCEPAVFADVTSAWLPQPSPPMDGTIDALLAVPFVDANVDLFLGSYFGPGGAMRGQRGTPRWNTEWLFFDAGLVGEEVAAGDLDGDGRLDLVLGGAERRDGYAVLTGGDTSLRATAPSPLLADANRIWIMDFDGDGTQEILSIPDAGLPRLVSVVDGELVEDDGLAGLDNVSTIGPVVIADFDRDGDLDVFQLWAPEGTKIAPIAMILENDAGTLVRREGPDLLGIGAMEFNYGSVANEFSAADFDLDGMIDVFWPDGTPVLWLNGTTESDWGFSDRAWDAVGPDLGWMGPAEQAAVGDLDRDGDPDLAWTVNEGGASAHLLRNLVSGIPWLRVALHGPDGNARGVGAIVCAFEVGTLPASGCRGTGLVGMRAIQSSTSQLEALEALIASPDHDHVDVRVLWPSGLGATEALDVALPADLVLAAP